MNPTGKGGFQKGHPGGPGRPKRSVEQDCLATLAKAVSLKDWREITRRAVEDAKKGGNAARSWLSKHLVGDEPLAMAGLLRDIEELKAVLGERLHVHEHHQPTPGSRAAQGNGSALRWWTSSTRNLWQRSQMPLQRVLTAFRFASQAGLF